MIGFVAVQSHTDIMGPGIAPGAWFDRALDALILGQRALWCCCLPFCCAKGRGGFRQIGILGLRLLALQLDFQRILGIIAAVTTEFLHGSLNEALEDLVALLAAMTPRGVLRGEAACRQAP